MSNSVEIQGHRGARGLWPENSIYGFLKTMDLGVAILEMDVVLSGDGKVVVSHDPFFNPDICLSPGGDGINSKDDFSLYSMDYDEIAKFDCGTLPYSRFPDQEKIPTQKPLLTDVLNSCIAKDPKIKFNIEIKSKADWMGIYQPESIDEYVDAVMLVLEALPTKQYNLQSFDSRVLHYLAKHYPEVRLAYLIENEKLTNKSASKLEIDLYAISPYYTLLSEELVKEYQRQGLKVIPWTVNEVTDMKRLIRWGVDGIISDYPNRFFSIE